MADNIRIVIPNIRKNNNCDNLPYDKCTPNKDNKVGFLKLNLCFII